MKYLTLLFLTSLLLSCQATPRVAADRTIFHNFNSNNQSRKIFIQGFPEQVDQSLEFKNYKRLFENNFLSNGFTIVDDKNSSDLTAFISYGIDGGKTTTHVGSMPIYGSTGGGTTYHSGTLSSGSSFGSYSGTSYAMPKWGVTGSRAYSYNRTIYTRNLVMDIVETNSLTQKKPVKVFEGRITSRGCSSQINEVMPPLVEIMFKNFPGVSGKSENIEIPIKISSCQ